MYLRRYGKKVDGKEYAYWSLVESIRTVRGPRQRVVANIGKLPGLDKEERVGLEEPSIEVKCASYEGTEEVFVLYRSEGRQEKEMAIQKLYRSVTFS